MDPASAEAAPQAKPAAERLDGGVALIGTGESSVVLQVISGLTLLIIPHTIDAHAFLVFELKRESDGATFKASVAEDVNQVTWLPFILGLPWMEAGADHAVEKMALHLYQQFAAQGAFGSAPSKSKQEPTSAPAESRD